MFSVNEYVVYSTVGICRIVGFKKEKFGGTGERNYYILEPPI